jgi:hypothetical protein
MIMSDRYNASAVENRKQVTANSRLQNEEFGDALAGRGSLPAANDHMQDENEKSHPHMG